MNVLIFILRLLPVILSLLGFSFLAHRKLKIAPAFLPLFSCSTVTVVLFIGGLFGALLPTAYVLYAVGILLLMWVVADIIRGKYSPRELLTSGGTVAFAVLTLIIVVGASGISLLHVDNFSQCARPTHSPLMVRLLPSATTLPEVPCSSITCAT